MMKDEDTPSFKHLKEKCICCEESGKEYSREHVFPKWLLDISNTKHAPFQWLTKSIVTGLNCTIPLCIECNNTLGIRMESKVKSIFSNIEAGKGFSDNEAEFLIRWMWKIDGLLYRVLNSTYSPNITVKQHVLNQISQPRERFSIAISIIENGYLDYDFAPIGISSNGNYSSIYCAGILSHLSIIVLYTEFADKIPSNWGIYTLSKTPLMMNPNNKFYPPIGFENGNVATFKTIDVCRGDLQYLHEKCAIDIMLKKDASEIKSDTRNIPLPQFLSAPTEERK